MIEGFIDPSCGTSSFRSTSLISSSFVIDGESPPCTQNIVPLIIADSVRQSNTSVQHCQMRAVPYLAFLAQCHSKYAQFWGHLKPHRDRVGDGSPQHSPRWAAGAGLPSSTSSTLTDSDEICSKSGHGLPEALVVKAVYLSDLP